MGKKSRRRRGAPRPRLSAAQLVQPGEQAAAPALAVVPQAPKVSARVSRDLKEEYPYMVADLKRIAIIAAIMLAVMIGLSFLLV